MTLFHLQNTALILLIIPNLLNVVLGSTIAILLEYLSEPYPPCWVLVYDGRHQGKKIYIYFCSAELLQSGSADMGSRN